MRQSLDLSEMYLHHLLELLSILLVVNATSRRQSRKHKEHHQRFTTTAEPDYYDEEDYDYHHNIQRDKSRLEPGNPYLMYHDSQQLPHRNKLLIVVVGG